MKPSYREYENDNQNQFLTELVISYNRETLSARIEKLDSLIYSRYSVFFNQQLPEIGPSHILISKRVVLDEYKWVCEDKSAMQDAELAQLVGKEIDRYLDHRNV
jgi:hypothetical protein